MISASPVIPSCSTRESLPEARPTASHLCLSSLNDVELTPFPDGPFWGWVALVTPLLTFNLCVTICVLPLLLWHMVRPSRATTVTCLPPTVFGTEEILNKHVFSHVKFCSISLQVMHLFLPGRRLVAPVFLHLDTCSPLPVLRSQVPALSPRPPGTTQLVKSLAKEVGLRVEAKQVAWTRPSEPQFSLLSLWVGHGCLVMAPRSVAHKPWRGPTPQQPPSLQGLLSHPQV